MITGILRVLIGFVVACCAAAATQVAFALSPGELAALPPDRWPQIGELVLATATFIALFAAPFALAAVLIAEIFGIRGLAFHALVGIALAAAAFFVLLSGEGPTSQTLVNRYAIAAFLTSGLVGGARYWLLPGRGSGGRRITRRLAALKAADVDAVGAHFSVAKSGVKPDVEPGAAVRTAGGTAPSVPSVAAR